MSLVFSFFHHTETYHNLMIFAIGGLAFADISIKSRDVSARLLQSFFRLSTPKFEPVRPNNTKFRGANLMIYSCSNIAQFMFLSFLMPDQGEIIYSKYLFWKQIHMS